MDEAFTIRHLRRNSREIPLAFWRIIGDENEIFFHISFHRRPFSSLLKRGDKFAAPAAPEPVGEALHVPPRFQEDLRRRLGRRRHDVGRGRRINPRMQKGIRREDGVIVRVARYGRKRPRIDDALCRDDESVEGIG